MEKDRTEEKRSNSPESESNNGANRPQTGQQNSTPQEGDYRNVETAVNNKEYFGDEYEIEQEDELTMEEPKTEKAGKTGKS